MNGKRDRSAILEFQDYQANKGLLQKATANSRKAALSKVLNILSPEEAQDITIVDLDELMIRFSNLKGKDYTPASLNAYKSRVKAALDDFATYIANPLGFRPSVARRERSQKTERTAQKSAVEENEPKSAAHLSNVTSFDISDILPIPLRQNVTVRIHGLPYDMTHSEAKKVANVILAMAEPPN